MPIVTALEYQKRNKDRVSLYLDDEFACELPLVRAAKLQRGHGLSTTEVQALIEGSLIENALDRAVNFLSYRPRSCQEVRRHLHKVGLGDSVIAAVMQRLQQQGYVDDFAFARFWIENRESFKPMSPRALAHELYQKGVDRDVFTGLLEKIDVDAAAYRAATKQLWRVRGRARNEFRKKLSALLQRRGFDFDTIASVVSRLQCELEESQPDYFTGDDEV